MTSENCRPAAPGGIGDAALGGEDVTLTAQEQSSPADLLACSGNLAPAADSSGRRAQAVESGCVGSFAAQTHDERSPESKEAVSPGYTKRVRGRTGPDAPVGKLRDIGAVEEAIRNAPPPGTGKHICLFLSRLKNSYCSVNNHSHPMKIFLFIRATLILHESQ